MNDKTIKTICQSFLGWIMASSINNFRSFKNNDHKNQAGVTLAVDSALPCSLQQHIGFIATSTEKTTIDAFTTKASSFVRQYTLLTPFVFLVNAAEGLANYIHGLIQAPVAYQSSAAVKSNRFIRFSTI